MITHETIDGRPAVVAYINDDFELVSPDDATMIKVIFDDGEVRFGTKVVAGAEEQEAVQRKSRWQDGKRRALSLLQRFNQDHDPQTGEFTGPGGSGGGGSGESGGVSHSTSPHAKDPKSASSLLRIDKGVTVEKLYSKIPGSKEQAAVAEAKIAGDGQETKTLYQLPNGNYAPDRLPTHAAIIQKLMPPEMVARATVGPREQPTLYILGGRGGSGKGWFTGKDGTLAAAKAKSVYINNDDVKDKMPEWEGWNAGAVHEEASDIGEKMEQYARDNRLNTIVDATLKSKSSLEKRIAAYKAAGYKISGHYMYAPPEAAATRALGRFVSGNEKTNGKGRYVRPQYSLGSTTNEDTFDSFRNQMDFWEVFDNSGSQPKLHSRKE